jgi:hypothetical protein
MAFQNCPFDITPFDKSNLIKTPNLNNLNYTNQDFWSMKSRLLDFIQEKFENDFGDFVESDLAIMLIENWAFIADTLSFKMDQIANEIFIDTVSEIDNAFRLSILVGFKPQPPIGARSLWSVSINNVLATDLVIPAPQLIDISTEDGPKTIELFPADQNNNAIFGEDILITAGNFLNTSVIGLEGLTVVQSETGDGSVNQFVNLTDGPVIWNSIRVNIDGNEWKQVNFFTDSQPRKEFRVEYDSLYNAFVLFGNNRAGQIPSDSSQIRITYRTGGGVSGNIVTNAVALQRNFSATGFDFNVPVSFVNFTRGEFGYEGDSIEDIKRNLPAWLRTQNRVVAGDDYEAFTDQFSTEFNGKIGKSKAILRNYGCAANVVDLYILGADGDDGLAETNNELKIELQESIDAKKMITDKVCIRDGVVVEVDVTIDVTMDKFYRKFEDEYRERVDRKTVGFFLLPNWDYEKTLRSVDLLKELSDIKEIASIDFNFQTDVATNSGETVTTKFFEIIRPVSIEINFEFE